MKKFSKILSVALVLVLALSVMVLPTTAAEPVIKADVVAEYQGKTTKGQDYYKFSVYVDSTLSLGAFQCNITWDQSAFTLVRATNINTDAPTFNALVMNRTDPENILYKYTPSYADYGMDNGMMFEHEGIGDGYAFMPADAAAPTVAVISNTNMGETLTAAGYTGVYMAWMNAFTDSYLNVSGGSLNGANAPSSGKQMIMSWYMRVADGAQPGKYEVGFNAQQLFRLTGTYCTEDAIASKDIGVNKKSITQDQVTYTNAMVTIGEEGPAVTKTQAEVKMTLNEEKTAVDYAAAPFQFRVISSISEDDWNTYFNGDGSNIESVGFVAYKGDGAFDMETAKSVAMGGSSADYQAAKTDYIQKVEGQAANFGARIDFTARENVKDVTYIAFVQYDTDQYAFYDTSYSVALNQNYDSIVSQYAGFIAG